MNKRKPSDGESKDERIQDSNEQLEKGQRSAELSNEQSDASDSNAFVTQRRDNSFMQVVSETIGFEPRINLREASNEPEPGLAIQTDEAKLIPTQTDRYEIVGEIARGGMGVVLRARDRELGRDLAIKTLRDGHSASPESLQRFIEEAQINGQLQHPGIAPIYDVGQFTDERPYFSMKLIKGRTLSALLSDRRSLDEDRSELFRVFQTICQAMAYAHSRGVIHRDLKPANIMVGTFGEVQVMDWGLAKVIATGGVADEKRAAKKNQPPISIIRTVRSEEDSGGSDTRYGSVLGTPAYMAPEQALGEVDEMDARADVFGLGAVLAEIMTGQPPYAADSVAEIHRMAIRGDLVDCLERLGQCNQDEGLVEICRTCLEPAPDKRFADAGQLSTALSQYRDSVEKRVHEAEIGRAAESARAEEAIATAQAEAKRRKLSGLLAAAVVLIMGMAATGVLYSQYQNNKVAAANADMKILALRSASEKAQRTAKTREGIDRQLSIAEAALSTETPDRIPSIDRISSAKAALGRALEYAESNDLESSLKNRILARTEEVTNLEKYVQLHDALVRSYTVFREASFAINDVQERASTGQADAAVRDKSQYSSTRRELRDDLLGSLADIFSDLDVMPCEGDTHQASQRLGELPVWLRTALLAGYIRWAELNRLRAEEASAREAEDWILTCFAKSDQDQWRGELCQACLANDIDKVLRLARKPELESQPDEFLLVAAERLSSQGRDVYFREVKAFSDWETLVPIASKSLANSDVEKLDDGSILLTKARSWTDTFQIVADVPVHQIRAIKLETFLDDRLEGGGPGNSRRYPSLAITEFRIYPKDGPDGFRLSGPKIPVNRLTTDVPSSLEFGIDLAFDGTTTTAWFLEHKDGQEVGTTIIELQKTVHPDSHSMIQLSSGQRVVADTAKLGRFRLSFSRKDLDIDDPREVGIALLDRVLAKDPGSQRLSIAMAQSLTSQQPPQIQEAIRYATAAVALNPKNAMAHAVLVRMILMTNPAPKDRLMKMALASARRIFKLESDRTLLYRIARAQTLVGDKSFVRDDNVAINAYKLAMELAPDREFRHANLGYVLAKQKRFDEAIEWFKKGEAVNPNDEWLYSHWGSVLAKLNKFEAAIAMQRRSLAVNSGNFTAWDRIGQYSRELDNHQEAAKAFRKAADISNRPSSFANLAIALVNCDQLEDAYEAFLKSAQLGPLTMNSVSDAVQTVVKLHEEPSQIANCFDELKLTQSQWKPVTPELMNRFVLANQNVAAGRIAEALTIHDPEFGIGWEWLSVFQLIESNFKQSAQAAETAQRLSKVESPLLGIIEAIRKHAESPRDGSEKQFQDELSRLVNGKQINPLQVNLINKFVKQFAVVD